MNCPDCGTPWDVEETPRCEGCDLGWSDVQDAADFFDQLSEGEAMSEPMRLLARQFHAETEAEAITRCQAWISSEPKVRVWRITGIAQSEPPIWWDVEVWVTFDD